MKFRFYALQITILCLLVFIVQLIIPRLTDLFILDSRAYHEIWRFLTSIFLHASVAHLLYNAFALVLFGSILELMIGGKRFLAVFFISGILANLVAVNFYSSSLGASGAIYGIIGALILIRPLLFVWAFCLPMPMIVAGVIWVTGDIIGIFAPSGVANIAHLAGIAVGLILGAFFRSYYKKLSGERAKSRPFILDEDRVRAWEDYYLR